MESKLIPDEDLLRLALRIHKDPYDAFSFYAQSAMGWEEYINRLRAFRSEWQSNKRPLSFSFSTDLTRPSGDYYWDNAKIRAVGSVRVKIKYKISRREHISTNHLNNEIRVSCDDNSTVKIYMKESSIYSNTKDTEIELPAKLLLRLADEIRANRPNEAQFMENIVELCHRRKSSELPGEDK